MKPPRKPPTIRKGQKRPFIKATNEQIRERIEFVSRLLVKQLTRSEIHRAVCPKYNVVWRTADNYIACAKKYLLQQAQMTSDEAKSVGINVLTSVFRDGKPGERVQAERRWAEIWGYNAPTVVRDSRLPGEAITITNPAPTLPQVHLYLPEGRSIMFIADPAAPAAAESEKEKTSP